MEINTQLSGTMALLLLSIFTYNAQACYYEGDPVWTGNHFDVPEAVNDENCYYSGDPVLIAAGQYDNPILFADNSYYTADEQEVSTHANESNSGSEFSAFEDQNDPVESSDLKTQNNKNNQDGDKGNNKNWTPQSWDLTY